MQRALYNCNLDVPHRDMSRTRQQFVERTSLNEAVKRVLEKLGQKDRLFTISRLGQEAHLNRRTVEKVLELLRVTQSYFEKAKLTIRELKGAKLVGLEPRFGILGLPEETQKLIIRTAFYPEPNEQQRIVAHLYLRGAVSKKSGISMDMTPTLTKLTQQGQVIEDGARFYLSDEGNIVARGTLDLYPELKETIQQLISA